MGFVPLLAVLETNSQANADGRASSAANREAPEGSSRWFSDRRLPRARHPYPVQQHLVQHRQAMQEQCAVFAIVGIDPSIPFRSALRRAQSDRLVALFLRKRAHFRRADALAACTPPRRTPSRQTIICSYSDLTSTSDRMDRQCRIRRPSSHREPHNLDLGSL